MLPCLQFFDPPGDLVLLFLQFLQDFVFVDKFHFLLLWHSLGLGRIVALVATTMTPLAFTRWAFVVSHSQ
jgi:hypothetical protein